MFSSSKTTKRHRRRWLRIPPAAPPQLTTPSFDCKSALFSSINILTSPLHIFCCLFGWRRVYYGGTAVLGALGTPAWHSRGGSERVEFAGSRGSTLSDCFGGSIQRVFCRKPVRCAIQVQRKQWVSMQLLAARSKRGAQAHSSC